MTEHETDMTITEIDKYTFLNGFFFQKNNTVLSLEENSVEIRKMF